MPHFFSSSIQAVVFFPSRAFAEFQKHCQLVARFNDASHCAFGCRSFVARLIVLCVARKSTKKKKKKQKKQNNNLENKKRYIFSCFELILSLIPKRIKCLLLLFFFFCKLEKNIFLLILLLQTNKRKKKKKQEIEKSLQFFFP